MNNTLTLNLPVVSKLFFLDLRIILRIFLILSILSMMALLVFYIFQVNAEVRERYLIQDYENILKELTKENQRLEINLAQTNSLDNVIALVGELNFEKVDKIHYIKVLNNQMVSK